ncbi:alpha-glycerophosphate oxidase/glycerol-3-phosphate dehydrogenase [Arenicella xantha]|uniref:Alpha-glycerophosphate oxidase/glycerol-3-phosphate dehydrogenase n=2 Tax=Arenicella xantha TaxID=644221 RepID=A0A395JPZ9_9GAMM|nr:glycerol-3-phosphate dehydrogenase/oxidase [Arenicella xantha]RBP51624.1 alpha-glycerophosphate oxidase/glycerol-3-phosphate dehydrogenase [Arenicella xantha]
MDLRTSNIERLQQSAKVFDVLVLGGGVNGAVSAASLAAKGASVALIDRGDFAGLTSSNSSNLAWGGIKYLESHEYLLVNSLCKSRNHLMRSYPSTVKEIRFLTTIAKGFRFPSWFVYLGTLFYWIIGRFFTQAPDYMTPRTIKQREPAVRTDNAAGGFEYSDAYLYDNDARFVFNFIRTSMNYGCVAANYVESTDAVRRDGVWEVAARDTLTGDEFTIRSKVLINACGPYVDQHNQLAEQQTAHRHLFSKGIHLIIDRVTKEDRILAFFASDGRLFFVIPMGNKTSVGTTDTQVDNPAVEVTDADRQFVLDNINELLDLESPITFDDVIAERCGVRPLAQKGGDGVADWVKLSRKHAVDVNQGDQHLSIFGGKTTDCINVGNEVAELVQGMGVELPFEDYKWYGEDDDSVRDEFYHQAKLMDLDGYTVEGSSEPLTQRLWRRYGGNALELLEDIRQNPRQAERLMKNAEYLRCEIEHTARHEMVTKLEDFLRRRSKITQVVRNRDIVHSPGLKEACKIFFGDQAEAKLQEYIDSVGDRLDGPNPF